jgi:hypothetical protein
MSSSRSWLPSTGCPESRFRCVDLAIWCSCFPSRNLFQVRATRTPTPAGRRGTRGWTQAPGESEVHRRVRWCFTPDLIPVSIPACAEVVGRIGWNGCPGAAEVDSSVVMVCACSLRTQQCVDECQCQLFWYSASRFAFGAFGFRGCVVWVLLALLLLPSVGGQCFLKC